MSAWFLLAFFIQGSLIVLDEFLFHRKRYLPKWERWGHPLDNICLCLPLISLVFFEASSKIYLSLCVFSCLFVTKDEWVHQQYCSGTENWLHSILFLIHPVVLFLAWRTHLEGHFPVWTFGVLFSFLVYQIYYWNIYGKRPLANR